MGMANRWGSETASDDESRSIIFRIPGFSKTDCFSDGNVKATEIPLCSEMYSSHMYFSCLASFSSCKVKDFTLCQQLL